MTEYLADNKNLHLFVSDTQALIERLSLKAQPGDIAILEKLVENFKIKTEDFYRENRKLNIGVVGQVKSGKSSFLNTLLFDGREILPKASTPKTATLTKIEYSEQNVMQIEYYSKAEWGVLEDNALIDLDDEVYTSAREIVGMLRRNGLNPEPYLAMGTEKLEYDSYDDLIANLNTYVGEDGKFTPIVKAVTLYLDKEEIKGISIVDTPGLNDPIASRTIRTKEFMEVCDVVFFLSQSGSFLDKSDWTLLSSQLPQKGVKKLVLVASKYDSGIRDVLRFRDEDDIFDDNDGSTADNIPDAYNIIKRKLSKRTREKVAEFVRDLSARESSKELISVIEQCAKPVLVSAMACNMMKKSVSEYSAEEQNVYNALKPFSKDMERDLYLLGNFDEVRKIYDGVISEKELILAEKARSFIPIAIEELYDTLKQFKEKVTKRLGILQNVDKEQLTEQKKFFETQINNIKADVIGVFGEISSKIESEKASCLNAMREASKYYIDVKERVGEKVHHESYEVSDSRCYNPFSWGSSHTEHYTYTEKYSYCMASDAVDNLSKYALESVGHIEKVFSATMEFKEIKRKLLNVVVNNFDMGNEKYDSSLFRIMIEESISGIELPTFSVDTGSLIDDIAAKFTGELTSAKQRAELKAALASALSKIYDVLHEKLSEAIKNFRTDMNNISKTVEDRLLENINAEFDVLLSQYENKEKEIEEYETYLKLLEVEIAKL